MSRLDTCSTCGGDLDDLDRFCAECGSPCTGAGPPVGEPSTATEELQQADGVMLLGPAVDRAPTGASPRPGLPRWLTVGGAVVVALMGWVLLRPDTEHRTGVAAPLAAGAIVVPEGWASAAGDDPEIAFDIATFDAQVAESSAGGDAGWPVLPPDAIDVGDEIGRNEPVPVGALAGMADHYLVVANGGALSRIDGADGRRRDYTSSAQLMGDQDELLVLMSQRQLLVAPAADPEATRAVLDAPSREIIQIHRGSTEAALVAVVADWGSNVLEAIEIDLVSGTLRTMEEMSPGDQSYGLWMTSWSGDPDRVRTSWAPGLGTYTVGADGTVRTLSTGFPLTIGDQAALLRICSAPGVCEAEWIDLDSGEPLDRRVPDVGLYGAVAVDGDDRILAVNARDTTGYFDVESGRWLSVDLGWGDHSFSLQYAASALSADGRYLFIPGALETEGDSGGDVDGEPEPIVVVYDRDEGTVRRLAVGELDDITKIAVVAKESR